MDKITTKCFEIKNIHDSKILFRNLNINNYEDLREKILLDINIEHKEFLIPLRHLKPALFLVECKISSNGLFNIQNLTNIFQQYGDVDSIKDKKKLLLCSFF